MKAKRPMYVVVTPERVFAFTSHAMAFRFYSRAAVLPSMAGKEINLVTVTPRQAKPGASKRWPVPTFEESHMCSGLCHG